MHGVAVFMNLSTHRLRLMMVVREVAMSLVVASVPSASDELFAEQMIAYLTRWSDVMAQALS